MKIFTFNARLGFFLLMIFQLAINPCDGQSTQNKYPHYVVVGGFSILKNAEKYTAKLKGMKLDAKFELNPNRNLYYVYVLSTSNYRQAFELARKLRKDSGFKDVWVYNGPLGASDVAAGPGTDINPDDGNNVDPGAVQNPDTSSLTATDSTTIVADSTLTSATDSTSSSSDDKETRGIVFEIYRGMNDAIIDGEISVINPESARKVATYKGNTVVNLTKPKNNSGDMLLVAEIFGYRKVQKNVNWANLTSGEEIKADSSGNYVIPFELVRLQKGDIVVMYNVYFFKDAAIMQPESRYELNTLLEMLNENPAYKIKIHGHTNGNAAGKIITMSENNFFSLTDSKDGIGSAKKLSLERAKVIRDFLVTNGIATERMQIKSWGGKRPLYDKHGPRAQENVRVEIEILED